MKPEMLVNEQITAKTVRLIVQEDDRNEIVSLAEAVRVADNHGLDLVQINDQDVPVCKVMDYSRYVYEMKQLEKKKAKQQRVTATKVKEIHLSPDIGDNDCKVKQNQIRKFLDQGMQVRIQLKLVGRARGNQDMIQRAQSKMEEFVGNIPGKFAFTQDIRFHADTFSAVINFRKEA